jgi:RNA polymerase sigma-70 factor (ECF subfamily)
MTATAEQDRRYQEAAAEFGAAVERLARGYEANPERCRDLVQDIHVVLWRSLKLFDGRCSLRTWVYRVAHNTATSHVLKERRKGAWVTLDAAADIGDGSDIEAEAGQARALERLMALIQALEPSDRQIMLLYLEGLDAAATAEITGLKSGHIATKIHRIKALLSRRFHAGGPS